MSSGTPTTRLSRAWISVLAVLACGISIVSLVTGYLTNGLLEADYQLTLAAALVLMIAAGLIALRTPPLRRNGALLLGTACVVGLYSLGSRIPQAPGFAFVNDVMFRLAPIMLAHLLVRWPRSSLTVLPERVLITAGYAFIVPVFIASDLFFDPAADAGMQFIVGWPTIVHDASVATSLDNLGEWSYVAFLVLVAAAMGVRLARATRPEFRELWIAAVATLLLIVAGALRTMQVYGLLRTSFPSLVENVAFATVPLAVVISTIVSRLQRGSAVEELLRRGRAGDAEGVVAALRRAMGDPRLDVAVYAPDAGRYVALDGSPAPDVPHGRRGVFVPAADGSPLARLDVDPRLAGRSELVEALAQSALVAFETTRLRAELALRAEDEAAVKRALADAAEEGARLSRLLPGGLPEKLRSDPGALGRIDEAHVSVLMADVRGYTSIAEHTSPSQIAVQLREHRSAMNDVILAAGGTIMQYAGDEVMAVFGAPFPQPDHAERAVRAAAEMHDAQRRVNVAWAAQGWEPFGLGIGVSSGTVATAILGSADRYEYTVVGDTVNLAQRLENEARPAGTTVLSDATVAALPVRPERLEPLPVLVVKGRVATVSAFAVRSPAPAASSAAQAEAVG